MRNSSLIELLPLIIFFAVYYFTRNIYLATTVCIIASWLALLGCRLMIGPLTKNSWLSPILITVFGGLTVALHNKTFIMLKPTVLYLVFGLILFLSEKKGKNMLELLLKEQINLERRSWQQLNWQWIGFFVFMAGLNLVVAFHFSEYIWVKFKVFGGSALLLINALISGLIIYAKARGKT